MTLTTITMTYLSICKRGGLLSLKCFLKSMPTTELANTDTAYNTINYLSLHLIDRNFFSPIYIVVRAVRNCVLSENWREYKSDKKQKLW